MARSTIRARLIKGFTWAILIPSLVTATVGVRAIQQQVYSQAQAQVNSNLEGAREICTSHLELLKDAIRIHATRMVIYRALDERNTSGLEPEMDRVRAAEKLDFLALTDATGRLFYRTRNPSQSGEDLSGDPLIQRVLRERTPARGFEIMRAYELVREHPDLARQALMEITPTAMAAPSGKAQETSGMVLKAAAPVLSARGQLLGVLYGGVLISRNYEMVDKIRETVFKGQVYQDREVGTATIFQDDVRISTNVRDGTGTRAITTRASAEVTDAVLRRGERYLGRAFVVNDWYMAAYEPIRNPEGRIIGMLYVGTLERPYRDSLWQTLFVFVGIALVGALIVSGVAVTIAGRISRPIQAMAEAARKVEEGDYSSQVEVRSQDEIGHLAQSFNSMVRELARVTQELKDWAAKLETKVEERTAQLRAMQSHLLQAEKLAAIGKLAAGVAHEINNPLTGILTNASLMRDDLTPEDPKREDLNIIVGETLRCRKIVKGLLDFARQTKPQKQAIELNRVVLEVLDLVRNQAAFRNIDFETHLDPNTPTVMADRDQMRQVVLNIVLNAAEAMPDGGTIRVSTRMDSAANQIVVSIQDTGAGIPPEAMHKLFEPFFTTKKTGTGLGLAIGYGIMERHRGTINVDSVPGKGTTISLRLPAEGKEEDG
jgi:two-component system NtrC family sensor kinase